MKKEIKQLLEKLIGTHIYRLLPDGVDLFHDLGAYLPHYEPDVVFDVGANVGRSVTSYLHHFAGAQIFCFEPVCATFSTLKAKFSNYKNVHCFKLGLGSRRGVAQILLEGTCDMYRLIRNTENPGHIVEDIWLETIDDFCADHGIPRIGLLKVDTEGHDLEVLKGSASMLTALSIDLIQVEAGMSRRNTRHVPIEAFKEYLEPRGYFLFRIYEQVSEWPTGEPQLRRSNPVFLSNDIIERNRREVS